MVRSIAIRLNTKHVGISSYHSFTPLLPKQNQIDFLFQNVYDKDKKRIKQGLENSKKINLERGESILPW